MPFVSALKTHSKAGECDISFETSIVDYYGVCYHLFGKENCSNLVSDVFYVHPKVNTLAYPARNSFSVSGLHGCVFQVGNTTVLHNRYLQMKCSVYSFGCDTPLAVGFYDVGSAKLEFTMSHSVGDPHFNLQLVFEIVGTKNLKLSFLPWNKMYLYLNTTLSIK